ncbi:MAG: hypothetical protein V4598_04595 [Bdellovibrionota bacterium]
MKNLQEKEDEKQSKILHEIVIDRFEQYLALPLLISHMGAEFVGRGDILKSNYEIYTEGMLKLNPEFLGFNIVNPEGIIVRTSPEGDNARARGKVTQMYSSLLASYNNKEPYYLSAPFRLFQGEQGFVLYKPMIQKEKLKGWYCIVISVEDFLEKFRLEDFLKVYDLVIIDEETNLDYFATGVSPPEETKVYSTHSSILGRKMHFKTWRKVEAQTYSFPWYFSVIFSLILSLASAFMLRLYGQRKRASDQLRNMSILLRVTSKEALSNLIDIHSDFNRLNLPESEKTERLSRDINYLTNLIEQIDLLQTMAQSREQLISESQGFNELIQTQLDNFGEVFRRKNVRIDFSANDFKEVKLKTNTWLFENSVLSNVFSHLLIYIQENSVFEISTEVRGPWQIIIFRITREPGTEPSRVLTRRLEVARKVLELHEGNLKEEKENGNLVIRLLIPR